MSLKVSNPIQQRMNLLVEQWEAVAAKPQTRIVRILSTEDDKDMVDAFFNYLLGVDIDNIDIPIHFESYFANDVDFSQKLLKELEILIYVWNKANKDDLQPAYGPIKWKPDYGLVLKENPAHLFIANFNNLAKTLQLQKDSYLVAILKSGFNDSKKYNKWLSSAIEAGIDQKVRIIIADTHQHRYFDDITIKYRSEVAVLEPDLDKDNAMKQVSAMGDANSPTVQYRREFMLLMQGIEKKDEKKVFKHSRNCLDIANTNITKDFYWLGQVVVIYTSLSSFQVGDKNYKQAVAYASEAIQAIEKHKDEVSDENFYLKIKAQCFMQRGSMYSASRLWQLALNDFQTAAATYQTVADYILAIEAYRMTAYCAQRINNETVASGALLKAINIGEMLPQVIAENTTLIGVLKILLEYDFQKYIPFDRLNKFATTIYGEQWMNKIEKWKNPGAENSAIIKENSK